MTNRPEKEKADEFRRLFYVNFDFI